MRKFILIISLFSSITYSQWVQQYLPVGIDIILSIDFADANTGAAGGWGDSFWGRGVYTTNSGLNWIPAQVPDSSRSLVKLQMIDVNTGYIAGAYNIFKSDRPMSNKPERKSASEMMNYYERIGMTGNREDYRGLFLKTTNGGKNWFTHGNLPPNVYYLMGMKFINLNTGFVTAQLEYYVSNECAVLKTTNGGMNWSSLYSIDTADITNIYTSDGNKIFIAGTKTPYGNDHIGLILKSIDGGNSWIEQIITQANQISDVYFTNPTTGFAVSNIGGIIIGTVLGSAVFKTTNGGINWVKFGAADTLSSFESVEFVPGTGKGLVTGFKISPEHLLESLLIRRTTNYGNNWTELFIPDSIHIFHSSNIVDANNWFAAGGIINAIVYKTTNGGAPIGIEPISNEMPDKFVLYQNYPNPFNPTTKIRFKAPLSPPEGGMQIVSLEIYDVLGRKISSLFSSPWGRIGGATYEIEWDGTNYPSGVYFCKFYSEDASLSITKKMVLIK